MRRVVLVLATVVLAMVLTVLIGIGFIMSRPPAPTVDDPHDVTIDIPRGNLYGGPSFGRLLDISADGKRIVYVGQAGKGSRVLFVQTIGETEPIQIPGTGVGNRDVRDPTFSPDGRSIAYWAQGTVRKTALDGTGASVLGKAPSTRGIAWLDSNTLVLGTTEQGLLRLKAGEDPVPLVQSKDPLQPHVSPNVLPGNRAVLFTIANASLTDAHVWLLNLKTGEQRQILEGNAYAPRYVPTGHVVFGRGLTRELMAVRFDLSKLETVGSPQPVLSVPLSGTGAGGATDYAISETGVLVYTPHVDPASDTLRGLLGDHTTIHVRLNWFEELNRPVR